MLDGSSIGQMILWLNYLEKNLWKIYFNVKNFIPYMRM
jgi:hypothetical protein